MADSFETVSTDSAATNGIPQRRATAPISVSIDGSTGAVGVPVIGEPPRDRRAEIIAKFSGRKVAEVVQEPPPVTQPVPDPDPPAEDAGDEDAPAEDGDEPEEGSEEEAPEPEQEPDAAIDPDVGPAVAFELEQARLDLAAAQRELRDAHAGRREADFDAYFDDPLKFVRSAIASTLGVEVGHALVDQEIEALRNNLTWSTFGAQDLPDSTKDQLSREGLDRKIRLDAHRRQSDKKAAQSPQEDKVAQEIAATVFERSLGPDGLPLFPDAARYAEMRFRRPIGEIILDVMVGAARDGRIRDFDNKSDTELFSEASRLLNDSTRTWAQQKGLPVASLPVATVPTTPGATPRPTAAQTAPSPAAPKKAPTAKPRTLPQAKAGAAPSRPVTPQQDTTDLPLESGERMRALFKKYGKSH